MRTPTEAEHEETDREGSAKEEKKDVQNGTYDRPSLLSRLGKSFPSYLFISSAWSSGSHSIQSLILLILIQYNTGVVPSSVLRVSVRNEFYIQLALPISPLIMDGF